MLEESVMLLADDRTNGHLSIDLKFKLNLYLYNSRSSLLFAFLKGRIMYYFSMARVP